MGRSAHEAGSRVDHGAGAAGSSCPRRGPRPAARPRPRGGRGVARSTTPYPRSLPRPRGVDGESPSPQARFWCSSRRALPLRFTRASTRAPEFAPTIRAREAPAVRASAPSLAPAEAPEPAPSARSQRPIDCSRRKSRTPPSSSCSSALSQSTPATTSPTRSCCVAEHGRRFPNGRLAEEREALRVRSLAHAGRGDEARRALASFGKRFPHSAFLPRLQEAARSADD